MIILGWIIAIVLGTFMTIIVSISFLFLIACWIEDFKSWNLKNDIKTRQESRKEK